MTKNQLTVGMVVVTQDGKERLVMPTKNDGLVLMAADNKALKVSKLADDLTNGQYRADKTVVKVYDVMNTISGHLFDVTDRAILMDRSVPVTETTEDDFDDEDFDDEEFDEEEVVEDEPTHRVNNAPNFVRANIQPGMLAITADGKRRLAIPTSDMGTVLATSDSKFIRVSKLNEDLTAGENLNANKTVNKVYDFAAGVTTDFYSEENRELLFDRDVQ